MTQGELLRLWRESQGLTLEALAFQVDLAAQARGIPRTGRQVPRTHASMSRWESDDSPAKPLGLEIIAEVYNVSVDALRRAPPPPGNQPSVAIIVPAEHADAVRAFLAHLIRSQS